MNRPKPLITLRNATFRLGDRLVFEDTSWIFRRGEHWAILGPNGSGKSLFADALRGRLPLVQGELRYHLRPPRGLSAEETIGHVSFEQRKGSLHRTVVQSRWNSIKSDGGLTVRRFLSYEEVMEVNPFEVTSRHAQARLAFERRLRRALRLFHLEPFLDHSLLSLSNGEMQRAQLARALCHPPRLLILDEPFIGLDAAMRQHFHNALERLMGSAVRVLLVTTRREDLPRHITHLLYLEDCQIVAAGRRREVGKLGHPSRPARTTLDSPALLPKLPFPPEPHAGAAPEPDLVPNRNRRPELVRLRNVTVCYGPMIILKRVTWTVRAGESWALLGPNGSGKTTLLSLLLGDNPQAYRNEVEVFGKRRGAGESIWGLKRQIGWVSPELHLHFESATSCLETVVSGFHDTIGLFQPATARQRAAARQWLARFGLHHSALAPLFTLSVGLQRMVLLARALVKKPRLLVLDEPCQGLDDSHRQLFAATLDGLIRVRATTVLYVTHRPDEIPASVRRVLRLSQGQATTGLLARNRSYRSRRGRLGSNPIG